MRSYFSSECILACSATKSPHIWENQRETPVLLYRNRNFPWFRAERRACSREKVLTPFFI